MAFLLGFRHDKEYSMAQRLVGETAVTDDRPPKKRFYADTPNEEHIGPPPNLGILAEDVVRGLKIALNTVSRDKPEKLSRDEEYAHSRELHSAVEIFARFIKGVQGTGFIPNLSPGLNSMEANRLGILPNGEHALFGGPVILEPGQSYPINYCAEHRVPQGRTEQDCLAGSTEAPQWYFGYTEPGTNYMDGYAVSVNQFLTATEDGALLDAIPKSGSK